MVVVEGIELEVIVASEDLSKTSKASKQRKVSGWVLARLFTLVDPCQQLNPRDLNIHGLRALGHQ